MESNNADVPELAGPERPAETIVGFHPLMGLDDRAVAKGVQRNDAFNNINAFSAILREQDQAYYSNLPMNTMDTDPSNTNKDQQSLDQLRSVLMERVAQVNTPAPEDDVVVEVPGPEAEPAAQTPQADLPPTGAWASFWHDVKNYKRLPTKPGWRRFHYVMTRHNRIKWFVLFIVVLMIFGYIFHMLRHKK